MESQVDLIIDVREQIRKMSANNAVVKSVSETLTQIENRITTVLDTLPFDAPLPVQQHDDVHPTASHRRPAIRRRTHHHILPSASTDTVTDAELVPSTAASTETVLPTCVAVATELASSSPAPPTLELLPSTSTSTESLLQMPTLVVVEPASSSLAPHNMELTPSIPTSTGHATPTITSIEPISSSPAPALLEMEPSISTSIEPVMPIHASATAETTSSAPAPTIIELESSISASVEHVAPVPSLAAAEAASSTPAPVITETAPSTLTSAESVPPTPTDAPETSSSAPTTVIIEPAPSTLASGEPVPPAPAPVVTEPASSPLGPTITTPPISTPTITDSTSPTPDPVFKEPAPSTLATSMMDTAPSVPAHIEAPSAFSILTQAVQSLIQQDSENGETPINKCTEEICDVKASIDPVKMEAHEANAHIEGAEMQKPMDVKVLEVTDIESQEAHGHMEANVHGTKEVREPIHGHGHVRSFVRKRKRRVYQQTSSAPH
ncbi:putative serine/threonine-protein phosphatase 7 long form [Cocos nucifera]|nr:putative serine/threonine-protein phosphatase 7 long form [Cocos nucifera]